MASHFSSLGIPMSDRDIYFEYFKKSYENGKHINTDQGMYTKWEIGNGIELWGQVDKNSDAIGMNPHFSGSTEMKVRIEKRVNKPDDTVLDGAFYGWADPSDSENDGSYPFVFDVPDVATYQSIKLHQIVTVQLTAFAHEISAYLNDEEYEKSQDKEPKFASEAFIPSGLFSPDGSDNNSPQAYAIFTGHILDTKEIINPYTNNRFLWARVKTLGGEIDIVIDPEILEGNLTIGGIVSGSYWLSGKIISDYDKEEKFSFKNLFGKKK
jgi:hypothetical protein